MNPNTSTPMPQQDLLSLPIVFNTMQSVGQMDWNGMPSRLMQRPFLYVAREASVRYSFAVVAPHREVTYFMANGSDLGQSPAYVSYQTIPGANGRACMVHTMRNAPVEPAILQAAVDDGGSVSTQVVRTTHADDQSEPMVGGTPTPTCFVEQGREQVVFHCILYMAGSGFQLNKVAAAQAAFTRQTDPQGRLVDWRLEIPLQSGGPYMLQYVSFTADKSIGIRSGDVVRVRVAAPGGNVGRSFAIPWP